MSSPTIVAPLARGAELNSESRLAALARPIKRAIDWIGYRRRLRRNLNELRALDDRMLRDIGLSRGDIEHVMQRGRPFDRRDRRHL